MKLTIIRDTGDYSKLKKINVLIDGQPLCAIANGETLTVDVPSGLHSISAKEAWVETNRISFDFDSGDKIVRLFSSYSLKDELKRTSIFHPMRNLKYTWNMMKGKNEDGKPVLELKDESVN